MKHRLRPNVFATSLLLYIPIYLWIVIWNTGVFPYLWTDETSFFLPAAWFATHGNLRPLNVNAPHGIFWVPDGFTVLLGSVLRVFGIHFSTAQHFVQISCGTGIILLAIAVRRWTNSRAMGVGTLLCGLTPIVVIAANMVRMEAVVFLFVGLATLLHSSKRYVEAACILMFTVLFHPACLLGACIYSILLIYRAIIHPSSWRMSWWSWAIAAFVAALLVAESLRYVEHRDLVTLQLHYQYVRKAGRPLLHRLERPQAILFVMLTTITLGFFYRCRDLGSEAMWDALCWSSIPFGIEVYSTLGAEQSYTSYMLFLCPVMIFAVWYRLIAASTSTELGVIPSSSFSSTEVSDR